MVALSRAVAWAAVLLAPAAASGPFNEQNGCNRALHDIAGQGHTDLQLSAYCHATLHPAFCRDATVALGSQPWSESTINSACSKWESQWRAQDVAAPERQAQDWGALQSTIQSCMKAKADAGMCQDPKTGQPMTLDACIDYKQKMYPEKTKKIQDALNSFYNAAMGTTPVKTAPEAKFEQHSLGDFSRGFGSGLACAMVLAGVLAAVAGVVAAKRAWKRRGNDCEHALVEDGA